MKKMKYSISVLLAAVLAVVGLQSCDLDEYNPSGTTADVVFSTPEGIESLVNAMYFNFRWKYFGREDPVLYLEGSTDIWLNLANQNYGQKMTRYEGLQGDVGQIANVWKRVYDNVNLANAVINRIGSVPYANATEKAFREGEARWMRSYCYWWLVEFFGDIEMRTQETNSPSFYAYRTPAETIYDEVIIPDAEAAVAKLTAESYDGLTGRATLKAAYGLLARVCLTRAAYCEDGSKEQQDFYTKALNAANYVINNKAALGIKLYNTYDEIWRADNNKNNTEYMFVVTHSSNSSLNPNAGNPNRLHGYFTPKLNGHVGIQTNATSWEYPKEQCKLMPTKYFLNLWEEGDARYDVIFQEKFYANTDFTWTETSADLTNYKKEFAPIENKEVKAGELALYFTRNKVSDEEKAKASYAVVDIDMVYHENGLLKLAEEATTQIINSCPRMMKYRVYDKDSDVKLMTAPNGNVGFADVPLMRYAEMPLIAAECYIGLGQKDLAAQVINNEVRTARVIKPGYEAQMKVTAAQMDVEWILAERARELCGEWLRWFDLKRTGYLVKYCSTHNPNIGSNIQEYHNLRPIPNDFLNKLLNAEEFGQNPGYNPYVVNK